MEVQEFSLDHFLVWYSAQLWPPPHPPHCALISPTLNYFPPYPRPAWEFIVNAFKDFEVLRWKMWPRQRCYWGHAVRARRVPDSVAFLTRGAVCPLSSKSLSSLEERTGRACGWDEGDKTACVWMSHREPHLWLQVHSLLTGRHSHWWLRGAQVSPCTLVMCRGLGSMYQSAVIGIITEWQY